MDHENTNVKTDRPKPTEEDTPNSPGLADPRDDAGTNQGTQRKPPMNNPSSPSRESKSPRNDDEERDEGRSGDDETGEQGRTQKSGRDQSQGSRPNK